MLERDTVEIVVQVNGRLRDRFQAPATATREELVELARARPNVQAHLEGREVVNIVVVPGRLVNFVVR
jgi:leucyl-tRNA synthetase